MNSERRLFLKGTAAGGLIAVAAAAGLLRPARVHAAGWNKSVFEARGLEAALAALGARGAEASTDIVITAPDMADNGAVVPITVTSRLPGTESIVVLAEGNTNPVAADFGLENGAEGYIAVRIKMMQSSPVRVLVRAGGKTYTAVKDVKVTIGGCGG